MRREVIIRTSEDSAYLIGDAIHCQLAGNSDYIDSNIVLNVDMPGEVCLYVTDEAKPTEIRLTL